MMDDFEKKKCDAFITAYSAVLSQAVKMYAENTSKRLWASDVGLEDIHETAFNAAEGAADSFVTWFIEKSGIDDGPEIRSPNNGH